MKAQIVCDYFPPGSRAGGPIRSLSALATIEDAWHEVEVVTRDRDLGRADPYSADELRACTFPEGVSIHRVRPGIKAVFSALRGGMTNPDVRYLNSVWSVQYGFVPLVLARLGVLQQRVLLFGPHGELAPSALAVKSFKKKPFLPLVRLLLSGNRIVFHATSEHEAQHIRDFMGGRDVVIITQRADGAPPETVPSDGWGGCGLRLVVLGRLAPVKNVELAVRAVAESADEVRLSIVGSLEDEDYAARIMGLVTDLGIADRVEFVGHCEPDEVRARLSVASAMITPTRGENFGHAIAEALSVGCPVLVPPTTMWTDVVGEGGFIIDTDDPAPAVAAIAELFAEDPSARADRRQQVLDVYAEWWKGAQVGRDSLFTLASTAR